MGSPLILGVFYASWTFITETDLFGGWTKKATAKYANVFFKETSIWRKRGEDCSYRWTPKCIYTLGEPKVNYWTNNNNRSFFILTDRSMITIRPIAWANNRNLVEFKCMAVVQGAHRVLHIIYTAARRKERLQSTLSGSGNQSRFLVQAYSPRYPLLYSRRGAASN